jgi:hypothetical protein
MLSVGIEYRAAVIAILVALAIFDACADEQQRRALEFGKSGVLQILRPPMSLVLWLCDVASDFSPIPAIRPFGGLSRDELKQHWADSWLTAPMRYLRSLNRGK